MVKMRNSLPKVYHGVATAGGALDGPRRSPVEYKVSYINKSYCDVTVAMRSGFSFTIPASDDRFGEKFIIRMELALSPWVRIDVEKLLGQIREDSNSELAAMKQSIELQSSKSRHGGTLITVDYPVTIEELKKYGGALYYSEIDQVVALGNSDNVPLHPYSEKGRSMYSEDVHGSRSVGFVYNLEIIDNSGRLGIRYVNINGNIYPLQPKADYGRRDGIYVRTAGHLDEYGNPSSSMRRVSFETAANDLGIFNSYEDAETLGDPDRSHTRELAAEQRETQRLKVELSRHQHERELDKLQRDEERQRNEDERARQAADFARMREETSYALDLRRIETKDRFEERSYVRKDSTEVIKALPGVIVGLGAIAMAVKSFL